MKRENVGTSDWVVVKEPAEVSNAGRRMVRAAIASVGEPWDRMVKIQQQQITKLGLADDVKPTEQQVEDAMSAAAVALGADEATYEKMLSVNDAAMIAVISGWSYQVPVSRQSLDELQVTDYDALAAAVKAAAGAFLAQMGVDFSIETPDPVAGAADPTGA